LLRNRTTKSGVLHVNNVHKEEEEEEEEAEEEE
jgi:hypothetical protein